MAWDSNAVIQANDNQKLKKIAICMPHTGFLHTEFNERTYIPLRIFPVSFCDKVPIASKTYSVTMARNTLVEEAIKYGCDYILWVDSDILIESVGKKEGTNEPFLTTDPNLALKTLFDILEQHPEVNFVSALYRAKKREGFSYAAWTYADGVPNGYVPISGFTGNFVEVAVTGLGFALQRVEPLKKLTPPWFKWDMAGEISEDFSYQERLKKELGWKIHLYTDVRLSHIGDIVVKSDGTFRTREG